MNHLEEIIKRIPNIQLDLRYATADNFTGEVLYPVAKAFLIDEVIDELILVEQELKEKGLSLAIWDAYRPLSVTKKLRANTPQSQLKFVADPQEGSIHNRGCAIDVTLYNPAKQAELEMPSTFDEFNEKAFPHYKDADKVSLEDRTILEEVMTKHGFVVEENEWWHYNWHNWKNWPVLDISIEAL